MSLSDVLIPRSFSASKQWVFFSLFKIYVWLYIILVIMLWLGLDVFREKYVVVLRQQFMSMRKLHWYHKNRITKSLACITDYCLQFAEMFTFLSSSCHVMLPILRCLSNYWANSFWGVWSWFFLLFIATSEVIAGLVVIKFSSDKWKAWVSQHQ